MDTATGCFLDASGRDTLAKLVKQPRETPDAEAQDRSSMEVCDPDTGDNLIAYVSGVGDGSYPVWIGRDADGEGTCFVADMLVLHHAKALPPTVPSTAACLSPRFTAPEDRREAPFTSPGATAEFIADQIASIVDLATELRTGRL